MKTIHPKFLKMQKVKKKRNFKKAFLTCINIASVLGAITIITMSYDVVRNSITTALRHAAIVELEHEINSIKTDFNALQETLDNQIIIANTRIHKVKLTAYTARREECESDPSKTAIMVKPKPWRTVAVSHDLKKWLGHKVYIPEFGVFQIEDLMNERFEKRMDICVASVKEAREFGIITSEIMIL